LDAVLGKLPQGKDENVLVGFDRPTTPACIV
jgi:hypothetical protein